MSNSSLSSEDVDKKLHEQCLYPTIMVNCNNHSGTGVIITSKLDDKSYKNIYLTCAHNLPENYIDSTVTIFTYKNWSHQEGCKIYQCKYLIVDRKEDIAVGVFETSTKLFTVDLNKTNKIYIGNNIFKIGCGENDIPRIDYGKISSVNSNVDILKNGYRISAYTVQGDSGGPIFNSDYQLIALTKGIRVSNDYQNKVLNGIGYGIPLNNIKNNNFNLNIYTQGD